MKRKHQRTNRSVSKKPWPTRSARKFVEPQTIEQFYALPKRYQDLWADVGQIATEVRLGTSFSKSARKFGHDPRTVRRLAPSAFRKLGNGRYAAKAHDRLLRVLVIPTRKGRRDIGVRDSRQASLLGKYSAAVERYLQIGDDSALRKFRGKSITDASGAKLPLLTDLEELDRLGSAGDLSFESLYARST